MTARGGIYGDMHGDGKPVADVAERSFVEVKLPEGVYRFYGRGEWTWFFCDEFIPVCDIFVPAEALKIAAAHCSLAGPPMHTGGYGMDSQGEGATVGMPAVQGNGQDDP